ncbi:MAG: N-acetylmuramoyl-L-alanine amidase [bacterium]|nr:N-acetylmuramoyl-L-alanine amidase [bacterium]
MFKRYKLIIFSAAVVFILALTAVLYFPISEKRTLAPKKTEAVSENNEDNAETENDVPEEDTNIATSEQKIDVSQKKSANNDTPDITAEKKPAGKISIISKLVTWGYSKSNNRSIDTIIIHSSYNALSSDSYDVSQLIEEYKQYGVSPHYLIDRKGTIYQLVNDQNVAYHAGESKMPDGRTNVNSFSLGIEMMTTEKDQLTEAEYQSLNDLLSYLKGKYKIKNVLGHNQIAPGRKTDPWNFDWSKVK